MSLEEAAYGLWKKQTGRISATFLACKLKIKYSEAQNLMDVCAKRHAREWFLFRNNIEKDSD